ncbi:MAG TPA: VOC family protein [Patescibacteria group bacterium]|nr:VOC family protein [Patescibacteria group bacterium]
MSIRLRQIALVANRLAPVIDDLKAVFGLEVCYIDPGVGAFGLENSLLPVGNNFIEVVAPVKDGTAGGRYLKRRGGDGGYMVICQCDTHAAQLERRERALKMGIRIAWERDNSGYHVMQLHPADTGGSFFEIDWDGKQEPEGHWEPAGGSGWIKAKRTEVVTRYSAVELQSPDPQGLAERWSQIAGVPIRKDSRGRLEMPLDNASVRFVEATDNRGEGLSGVDLVVADRARLNSAAEKRGLKISDDHLTICGTRFYLIAPNG